jgi:hypothetical protein
MLTRDGLPVSLSVLFFSVSRGCHGKVAQMLQHHLRIGRSGDEPINCKRPGQFMASSSGVNSGVWQTRTRRATCKGFEGRGGTYDFTHIGSRLLLGFGIVIKVFDE